MLLTSTVEVVVFVSPEQYSTVPHRPPLPPARVPVASKYLFALLLAANVLPPRELDHCNYYVKEASKPTLRAAD
ncbi:hypothetical protein HBI28_248410 [Parastagonospora nodorum]|nr:hypothetical protein HBI28_248410 [Parastagonospora nodorum]